MQSYDGATAEGFRLLSIPETLEFWRRKRGCAKRITMEVPPHNATDSTRAVVVEWIECQDPSPLLFYRIEGGGHHLPSFAPLPEGRTERHGGRSQTVETAEELWDFFSTAPSVGSAH